MGTRVMALATADADEPAAPPAHFLSGDHHHHFAIDEVGGVRHLTLVSPNVSLRRRALHRTRAW